MCGRYDLTEDLVLDCQGGRGRWGGGGDSSYSFSESRAAMQLAHTHTRTLSHTCTHSISGHETNTQLRQ